MSDLAPRRAWPAAHAPDARPPGTRFATMPSMGDDPALDEPWAALDAAGWNAVDTRDHLAVVARWRTHGGRDVVGPDDLAGMDRVTLFDALRWYSRGERFCDGLWATAWQDGTLHAGACAFLALGGD